MIISSLMVICGVMTLDGALRRVRSQVSWPKPCRLVYGAKRPLILHKITKKIRHLNISRFQKLKGVVAACPKRLVCLNRRDYVARHCMTPYRYVMCDVFCVIEAFLKFFGHKKHPKLLSVAKKRVHLQTPNRTKRNYSQQNTTLNHYGLRNYRHLRGLRHMSARMPR